MYGLRPLGGSLDSDDEEEREHRQNARDARAFLNSIKMAEPPTREQVRKLLDAKTDSAVRRVQALVESESDDSAATVSASAAPAAAKPASAPRAPRAAAAKSDTSTASSAPRAAGRSSRAVDVDLATLESRVTGLLDKLTSIETQLAEYSDTENLGLAARSRIKDLERQRTTTLHTLAALEKARRLQTQ